MSETISITLTRDQLLLAAKGVMALGDLWNKEAREETRAQREALREKLISAADIIKAR